MVKFEYRGGVAVLLVVLVVLVLVVLVLGAGGVVRLRTGG
jgi:hypothetical protein